MNSTSQPSPTEDDRRDGLPLRRLLLGLALLTLVASGAKVLGLAAPMPKLEASSSLRLSGYRISALPTAAPRQGRDLSLGTMRQFRLVSDSGEPQLTLTLLPVRSRTGTKSSESTLGARTSASTRWGLWFRLLPCRTNASFCNLSASPGLGAPIRPARPGARRGRSRRQHHPLANLSDQLGSCGF